MPPTTTSHVCYVCRSCGCILLDDPESWRRPPEDVSASPLGSETVVTSVREVPAALEELTATYPPGRLINQRKHGKLLRPGVVVIVENPRDLDDQRVRFERHPGCSRQPFVVKWISLFALAEQAREKGQARALL
jgi:hypothetical protein